MACEIPVTALPPSEEDYKFTGPLKCTRRTVKRCLLDRLHVMPGMKESM